MVEMTVVYLSVKLAKIQQYFNEALWLHDHIVFHVSPEGLFNFLCFKDNFVLCTYIWNTIFYEILLLRVYKKMRHKSENLRFFCSIYFQRPKNALCMMTRKILLYSAHPYWFWLKIRVYISIYIDRFLSCRYSCWYWN